MRRLERTGLVAATMATAAGVLLIGACTQQVSGTAEVDETDLAAYASEVTSSRAAAVTRATDAACDAFLTANGSSARAFNDYIDASNTKGRNDPDTNGKADHAVATLRDNARSVGQKVTREVPSAVADPLRAYRDDTTALADTLGRRADTDTLNAAIDRFNATKNAALTACQGHGTR
ncbi:hypothetical protein [Nocardia pneumoniae]|uniref:hypothetical protein n=1 Tax=Nocardia pneumoniae TaxID=228601 RepID=UPI0002FF2175|nr:hypothetical protein [Nocardia pneumoniae]